MQINLNGWKVIYSKKDESLTIPLELEELIFEFNGYKKVSPDIIDESIAITTKTVEFFKANEKPIEEQLALNALAYLQNIKKLEDSND
jgi:hypothetical protein